MNSNGLRQLALCAALGITALQLGACSSAASREARYRQKGADYLAAKNYEKARVELNNALQINPKDASAQYLAGQVSEKLDNVRDAAGHYQAALDLDPNQPLARAALGRLYLFAGIPAKAIELAEAGLKLTPGNAQLLTVRAAAKAQQGDRAGAMQDAQAAAQTAPTDEFVVALLGSLYRQAGDNDKAIEVASNGVKAMPGNVDLRFVLADLLISVQRFSEAEAQLQAIIATEPKVLSHRYRLARYYVQTNKVDAAEKTLREAIASDPASAEAKMALVQMLTVQRGAAQGEAAAQEFLRADPTNDSLNLAIAGYYQQNKRADQAQALYRAVIKHSGLKADGLTARDQLAAMLLASRDNAGARQLVDEVLKQSPADSSALLLHANLALAANDPATAVTDLRSVLRDQPNNTKVMRLLAQAHLQNNERTLAEEVLRSAMQVAPKDADVRLQLVQLLTQSNRLAEARTISDQLAKDQPDNLTVLEQSFRLQLAQNDTVAARATAGQVVQAHPTMAVGYYLQGQVDEAEKKPVQALADYEQALHAQPEIVEPLTAAVRLDLAAKEPQRALARLDAVPPTSAIHLVAMNLKGEVLVSTKHYAEAIESFNASIGEQPAWWVPYRGLALAQLALKEPDAAITTLTQGVAKTHALELQGDLGTIYEQQKRPEDAIKVYEAIVQSNPNSLVAVNNLAMLLASYRDDKASLDRAQRLVQQLGTSTEPSMLNTRGWVAYRAGDYSQALPLLQEAAKGLPGSALLRYRLGMAQLKTGDSAGARANLEVALKTGDFLGADQARTVLQQIKSSG